MDHQKLLHSRGLLLYHLPLPPFSLMSILIDVILKILQLPLRHIYNPIFTLMFFSGFPPKLMGSWSLIVWLAALLTDQLWTSLPRGMGEFCSWHTATSPTNKKFLLQKKVGSVRLAGNIGQLLQDFPCGWMCQRGWGVDRKMKQLKVLSVFTKIIS